MSFSVGLDIGQSNDPTALAALENVGPPGEGRRPEYHLRHIRRFELGTPYPTIVEEVTALLAREALSDARLVVDATGVGRPIVEMLTEKGLSPYSIWITGGDSVSRDGREFRVPKRELASTVQALLQSERLKFAKGLPHREVLVDELQKFRAKINIDTGEASFEHWRERDTDDVVLALACAAWMEENGPGPSFQMLDAEALGL